MDATAHLVAGAAAASRTRNPLWALLLGLATHPLLDAIPHANYTGWRPFSWAMVADVIIGGLLVLAVVLRRRHPVALLGAAGGVLPVIERYVSGEFKDVFARPPLLIPEHEIGPPLGLLTQALVVAVSLWVSLGARTQGQETS